MTTTNYEHELSFYNRLGLLQAYRSLEYARVLYEEIPTKPFASLVRRFEKNLRAEVAFWKELGKEIPSCEELEKDPELREEVERLDGVFRRREP